MKTLILCLVAICVINAHADSLNDDLVAKDLAQLRMVMDTQGGIQCQFQVLRGKISWLLLNRQYGASEGSIQLDAKQYAEIGLLITPSEQDPDHYQAQYSEKHWNLPKKMRFKNGSFDAMATQIKNSSQAKASSVNFQIQSLALSENLGNFRFATKDGITISGPTAQMLPDDAVKPYLFERFSTYENSEMDPNDPRNMPFELSGKRLHRMGGVDIGTRIDGLNSALPHVLAFVLNVGSFGVYSLATAHWHNVDQSIQTGSCTIQQPEGNT
jgi:hypothetical protein